MDSPHKAGDAELWCFLWSAYEQTVEQRSETPVIWDAIALTACVTGDDGSDDNDDGDNDDDDDDDDDDGDDDD